MRVRTGTYLFQAGRFLLLYHPPKSQVWGHRVGRLSAVQLHDLAVRFLAEQTHVTGSGAPAFALGWFPTRSPGFTPSVDGVRSLIASPPVASTFTNRQGDRGTELRWTVDPPGIRPVAKWIDEVHRDGAPDDFWVTFSQFTQFRWNDAAGHPGTTSGGMLGVHLGQPRAVSTQFSFASDAHYRVVKTYLSEIGLVTLSDKHLRPAPPPRRQPTPISVADEG